MKVKIKGLVFVGFAAAVFAQSAFAAIYQNDYSTVASKKYVDDYAQEETEKVQIGSGTGQFASTSAENFPWDSNDRYPSMKVLKEVAYSVAGIHGDTNYIEVTTDSNGLKQVGIITGNLGTTGDITAGTNTGRLATVGAVNGLLDTSIGGTETNNTVPTSLAVQTYAEATANKLVYDATNDTETISAVANRGDNTKFPTVKNVYEFVKAENAAYQPKVATASTANAVSIGYKADANSDATWGTLGGTGYVTISGSGGVYTANIDSTKIADASSEIVTSSSDLATAGAVYDFVNGNYQPKTTTQGVMTGYNGTWHTLSGDTYITVGDDGTGASVTLGNFAAATDLYGSSNANDGKLVQAGQVRSVLSQATETTGQNGTEYATTITGNGQNNVFPSAQNVFEFVMDQMGGLAIPEMPSECDTAAASGHYCALVYGKTSDDANASVGLMWTIMAPQS